jgi:hypothetical protein
LALNPEAFATAGGLMAPRNKKLPSGCEIFLAAKKVVMIRKT